MRITAGVPSIGPSTLIAAANSLQNIAMPAILTNSWNWTGWRSEKRFFVKKDAAVFADPGNRDSISFAVGREGVPEHICVALPPILSAG